MTSWASMRTWTSSTTWPPKLDEMSQIEYEQFQAAMEIGDHSGSLQEIINLTENLDCYDIYPDIPRP